MKQFTMFFGPLFRKKVDQNNQFFLICSNAAGKGTKRRPGKLAPASETTNAADNKEAVTLRIFIR